MLKIIRGCPSFALPLPVAQGRELYRGRRNTRAEPLSVRRTVVCMRSSLKKDDNWSLTVIIFQFSMIMQYEYKHITTALVRGGQESEEQVVTLKHKLHINLGPVLTDS